MTLTDKRQYLINFLKSQNLVFNESDVLKEKKVDYANEYKISLGKYTYLVHHGYLEIFWKHLSKSDFTLVLEEIEKDEPLVKFYPFSVVINQNEINKINEWEDDIYETFGEDYQSIDHRLKGLAIQCSAHVTNIGKIFNKALARIERDSDFIKDFDGVITFTTLLGKDFKLTLCFDKVSPINETPILIERTPITDKMMEEFFKHDKKKIDKILKDINSTVDGIFRNRVIENKTILTYTERMLNNSIIKYFLDQQITFISFGGRDNFTLDYKGNPNVDACYKYLDAEIEHIIATLENIPKEEGVDFYSLDIDTFNIYGRNKDNKVITGPVPVIAEQLINRYSKGFEQLLSLRMTGIDNEHFFKI